MAWALDDRDPTATPAQRKRGIRDRFRLSRRQIGALAVEAAAGAVAGRVHGFAAFHLAPAVVSYLADENEVATDQLNLDVLAAGRPLFLPRCDGKIGFVRWHPGAPAARSGRRAFGIAGNDSLPADWPAFFLLPLVAWDQTGRRLGRGGGFYDRALAGVPAGRVVVGLGYESQEHPELPAEPWDIRMDFVVTERRVVRCECATGAPSRELSHEA